jgi:hypothetical protein
MKKILFLCLCAASFATAQSQVTYGVKGGLNITNIGGADVEDTKAKVGVHAGGFLESIVAENISVRPELLLSWQGYKSGGDYKVNLTYLNIPLLAKYTFKQGFFAQAGPQIGMLLGAKSKFGSDKENIKNELTKIELALAVGAGYNFTSNIGIDIRFNLGLSKLNDDGDAKVYNRVWQAGVFYTLGSTKLR